MGDGEVQEGSVWEAAHVAPRYGADNLIGIVDHNQFQQFGWRGESASHRLAPQEPGDLVARFKAQTIEVAQAAAENLTPTLFELGGKDPMLILEDADIKAAARELDGPSA